MPTFLILGATGTVGGPLVEALVAQGARVRAATREPAAARLPASVEPVAFDLERPATFAPALDGADAAFLIARPGDDHPDVLAAPLVEAIARAGVPRVVSLSAMGVDTLPDNGLRRMERLVEGAGLAWTHLRPNFFFQVFLGGVLGEGLRRRGVLALPAGDARLSYLDARDIGAAAAAVLLGSGHEGRAYTLTGAEALDHETIARALSEVSGRPLRYVPLDEDAARAAISAAGLSPARVERLVSFYRLVRAGFCAPVSEDLPRLLGRPPTSFARFAKAHADAWRG